LEARGLSEDEVLAGRLRRDGGRGRKEGGRSEERVGREEGIAGEGKGGERRERGEYRQHRRRGVLGVAINPAVDNDHSATVLRRNSASPKLEKR